MLSIGTLLFVRYFFLPEQLLCIHDKYIRTYLLMLSIGTLLFVRYFFLPEQLLCILFTFTSISNRRSPKSGNTYHQENK